MTNELKNLEDVENIPLGAMAISLVRCGSELWLEQDNINRLKDEVFKVRDEVIQTSNIFACKLTRLIIFTSNYDNQVAKWQNMLGRYPTSSTDENSIATGKTIVWGNGDIKTTFPIIIINEAIGVGLIQENNLSLKRLCKAILAHEFGHVHDDFMQLNIFGDQPAPKGGDWEGIKLFIAKSLWGEFFAEVVASQYLDRDNINIQSTLTITLSKSCHENIKEAIKIYKADDNIINLWNIVCNEISKTSNQLGRVAGLISRQEDRIQLDELKNGLGDLPNSWIKLFEEIYDELNRIERIEIKDEKVFDILEKMIEDLFNINGIYPLQTEQDLHIKVTS